MRNDPRHRQYLTQSINKLIRIKSVHVVAAKLYICTGKVPGSNLCQVIVYLMFS
jgi:hypothetical protein